MAKKVEMKRIKTKVNMQLATQVAGEVLKCLDGYRMDQTETLLCGVSVAMMMLCKSVKPNVTEEDAVEKRVLGWLDEVGQKSGLDFYKYIQLPKVEKGGEE